LNTRDNNPLWPVSGLIFHTWLILLVIGFLLGLLSDLEDEGDIFLQHIGGLLMNYTVLQQTSYP
jgi:hypothetical protein